MRQTCRGASDVFVPCVVSVPCGACAFRAPHDFSWCQGSGECGVRACTCIQWSRQPEACEAVARQCVLGRAMHAAVRGSHAARALGFVRYGIKRRKRMRVIGVASIKQRYMTCLREHKAQNSTMRAMRLCSEWLHGERRVGPSRRQSLQSGRGGRLRWTWQTWQ